MRKRAVDPEPLTGGTLFGFSSFASKVEGGTLAVGFDNAELFDLS